MKIRKKSIALGNQMLIEKMQEINFGRIEKINVQNGEAFFSDESVIMKEFKPGADNRSRPEKYLDDFILKAQQEELIRFIKNMPTGQINSIEVKHGLPFRITTSEPAIKKNY